MAELIDGKLLAAQVREALQPRIAELIRSGYRPGLAVVLVGDDPASQVYVRNKIRACEAVGIFSEHCVLPADATETQVLAVVQKLNQRSDIHGILVQLPLPAHIDARTIIEAIDPDKDVDGFHSRNLGDLLSGFPFMMPCTPLGVMYMLEKSNIALSGIHAVVIGASTIVGKPMAMLLLQAGATVTVCHSKTRDLAAHTQSADLVIVAAGNPGLLTGDMVSDGVCVIDVGINRLENGTLVGDVDFESVAKKASAITPVPGGVGPMTIAMLLSNTVEATSRYAGQLKQKNNEE